jgi:hypothetical protein
MLQANNLYLVRFVAWYVLFKVFCIDMFRSLVCFLASKYFSLVRFVGGTFGMYVYKWVGQVQPLSHLQEP